MKQQKNQAGLYRRLVAGCLLVIVLSLLCTGYAVAQEQPPPQAPAPVQELTGRMEQRGMVWYRLPGLRQGQRLYVHAEGVSGNLDPLAGLTDSSVVPENVGASFQADVGRAIEAGRDPVLVVPEFANRFFLAWDDDSGGSFAAAFEYEIPVDGDYQLFLAASPQNPSSGDYRLLVGIDTPTVLVGSAVPTGSVIAELLTSTIRSATSVQELTGSLTPPHLSTYFDFTSFAPGDTLYVFAERTSGDLVPAIGLLLFGTKLQRSGEYNADRSQASFEYTFPADGSNYRLDISACCEDDPATSGDFRLLIGRNAPEVLTGQATPGGTPVIRGPTEVRVGARLQQITGIDQKAENYGGVYSLRLEWIDPQLAFSPSECNCEFKTFADDDFSDFVNENNFSWPVFTVFNQQGNRWSQNKNVVLYPDGRAIYFERFSTTLQAPDFNFRRFPFDQQEFFLAVDSLQPVERYAFLSDDRFNAVGQQLGEEEFYVTDYQTSVEAEQVSTQSVTSRFEFRFVARRHLTFYIFRILVPLLLIILVSWITFFLRDYGKRVDVSSANLLLFIAFNFTISNDLPRLGYLTFLDTLLVATFIISVIVVIYNVYLKRQEKEGTAERWQTIDNYMLWIYPLIYVAAFGIVAVVFFLL